MTCIRCDARIARGRIAIRVPDAGPVCMRCCEAIVIWAIRAQQLPIEETS